MAVFHDRRAALVVEDEAAGRAFDGVVSDGYGLADFEQIAEPENAMVSWLGAA
ncbi:hypothetical protein [Cryobacterium zongtaii]|uniref:hypothetical protein n=1 Tax=Cryobacterium zongtaii TaxID=1259217 RepID=UPI0013FE2E51|nr:hypothetical protein [Cryobacterium zongtaii]